MLNIEAQEVLRQAREYNLIPVVKRILADMETPIRLFSRFAEQEYAFLLESVEGGSNWARYSFIGTDPFITISGKNGVITVEHDGRRQQMQGKPIEELKVLLRQYRSPMVDGLPPFTGGAIGFFGYDLLQYYEKLPKHAVDDLQMDDIQFMFCDQVIVFDHVKQQLLLIGNVHVAPGDRDEDILRNYQLVDEKLEKLARILADEGPKENANRHAMPSGVELGDVKSNLTKDQFISNVEQAKEYIRAGDIFQVVLSQRFHIETEVSPLQVYRVLRTLNPSPYMYYLKLGEEVIVGTSPEALVKVDGGRVQTRPIAGTRPRGETAAEDERLAQDLLQDEKERAEHLMLVDLGRNDIGKVSQFGTVKCDSFMEIEKYSHVMHMVTNVSGTIREDKDFFDAFLSCLPAGTVSGAPKLRAMQIIAELEREARGAYAGAIGYLGFSGNMDSCITIRTIIFKEGKAYVQAGAGIVWDSVPEMEYEETVNKAKALLTAIRYAEQMFPKAAVPLSYANQDYIYTPN
ncbi:anthranilate synthase component I [Paenibacillus urinalis]|uniref:Anthranilate synthase component 1 n=1 Tax=Paenibacillus urinalis TaxID=521520 RepID=A0ABY7X7U0_9BACL|nr:MULTISPECIES: anthranilate synthase component I [Paenibacillus]WDH97281.1 anthranilate synthase component I [Paenibacillus urinalis]WDI00944.1 anthranilate synthase component I [Paenibacillus urinalis]GAK40013.1 anthranilate synthase component I [Paenibacillus sp. TCA20]